MKICFECDADMSNLYPLSPFVNELWTCPICGGPLEEIDEEEEE